MDYRVSLTDRLVSHVKEIGDQIAESSPGQALRWIEEFERQVSRLRRFPEAHPPARENTTHQQDLRHLLYGKGRQQYRIIFTIRDDEVIVLDVRHSARPELSIGELD